MVNVPVVEARNLTKYYRKGRAKIRALDGVSFAIYPGEFVIVFGPSGCGKSTLFAVLSAMEIPNKGEVIVRGENIFDLPEPELAEYRRKKIGMVFQNFNLISSMNALDNVALPLLFDNFTYSYRRRRAIKMLKRFKLEKRAQHFPVELSGGELQRIAIARALINNPWILFIDEPTGDLDSKNANIIMNLLSDLNKKGKRTIFLVTHNAEYLHFADRILEMKDGRIVK